MRPESSQKPSQNPEPDPEQLCFDLDFSERVDPAAADALWRIVFGGDGADTGGGPDAAGAGPRPVARNSEPTGGSGGVEPDASE